MADLRSESVDGFLRAFVGALVVPDLGQTEKIQCGNGTRGRFSAVVVFFQAKQNTRIVPGAAKVTAAFLVEEQTILGFLQFDRPTQPAGIEGSFVKVEHGLDQKFVIVSKTFNRAAAFAVIAEQYLPRRIVEFLAQKDGRIKRGLQILCVVQNLGGTSESRDHQAVPGGDDLVVEMRPRTFRPESEQRLAAFGETLPDFRFFFSKMLRGSCNASQLDQNIFAGEFAVRIAARRHVPLGFDSVMKIENFSGWAELRIDFLFVPNVERAFGFFPGIVGHNTVGIFGGKKATALRRHVATNVIKSVARDAFEERVARNLKCLEISGGELCLVVEHFLEV